MRRWLLVVVVLVAGCGSLKDPFAGLAPGGACTQDADCAIGSCPNACNAGQPFCTYPNVYRADEVGKACPCAASLRGADSCRPPDVALCGPQPGCIGPSDAPLLRASCRAGKCVGVLPDGGVPGAP